MAEAIVDKDPIHPVKVAVVQAEPCWFNVEAAVQKTCSLIVEAGANGAELVAFPELWIPGYPNFIYAHAQKACNEYMRRYFRNALSVDSNHMQQIRLAARKANIMVVLGIAEREKGSLLPTGANSFEACTMATHTYAIEGGAFVLLASHTQSEKGLVANGLVAEGQTIHEGGADLPDDECHTAVTGGGFTKIIAPDGRTIVEAPNPSFEGLIYANLDFNEIYLAKNIVDPVGQYSRADLFTLQVNSNVNRHCVYRDKTTEFAHVTRYPDLELAETDADPSKAQRN